MDKATLRGTNKVQIQVLLAYAVNNIKQLMKVMRKNRVPGWAKRLFPNFSVGFNSLDCILGTLATAPIEKTDIQ